MSSRGPAEDRRLATLWKVRNKVLTAVTGTALTRGLAHCQMRKCQEREKHAEYALSREKRWTWVHGKPRHFCETHITSNRKHANLLVFVTEMLLLTR